MAADCLQFDRVMLFAGKFVINCTKSSFHNTAGDAEDDARSGVIAHDIRIPVFLRKSLEQHTASADHAGKLAGCDDSIHIRNAVDLLLLALFLILLGNAGHDGDNEDILRINAVLLRPPGLDDGALHLVRGLAA